MLHRICGYVFGFAPLLLAVPMPQTLAQTQFEDGKQDRPGAHTPGPEFRSNATLIGQLRALSAGYVRRIAAAQTEVCALYRRLERPPCRRNRPAHAATPAEPTTIAAQRAEIARLRAVIAQQSAALAPLEQLRDQLRAELAARQP